VISSLKRDGSPVVRTCAGRLRRFAGGSEYVERCFKEYGLVTDPSGQYSALYKPFHLIGLELGISVASIGLRGEPTGVPIGSTPTSLRPQARPCGRETLDGEGGPRLRSRDAGGRVAAAAGLRSAWRTMSACSSPWRRGRSCDGAMSNRRVAACCRLPARNGSGPRVTLR